MIKLSLNLTPRLRLDVNLTRRRKLDKTPLLPDLGSIRRVKSGNKISRFFRHLFEHRNIKKILGTNLAIIALATSFSPLPNIKTKEPTIQPSSNDVVVKTTISRRYPVENVAITQHYHFFHRGVDFDGITGDPVYPIKNGVVSGVKYSPFGYGNTIYIRHDSETVSLYAHLSKIYVKKGEAVNTETKIGELGETGRSSGDHLHLEIYKEGKPVDPLIILPD